MRTTIKNTMKAALAMALVLPSFACSSDAERLYANIECHFTFYTPFHLDSRLTAALHSDETYAIVTTRLTSTAQSAPYWVDTSLFGTDTASDIISTAEETQRPHTLGLANGLIIGRSLTDGYMAYDRQCPSCYEQTGFATAPLSWGDNAATVVCTKCHRTYNLQAGGVVSAGEAGRQLYRYRISMPGDLLVVGN